MQSGLKILKIHPQPICQLQNCVEANKDLSRKYSNPNIDNPFQNQNTFLKTCQFTQKFWHQYWCFLVEMGVSKKVFFYFLLDCLDLRPCISTFEKKKSFFPSNLLPVIRVWRHDEDWWELPQCFQQHKAQFLKKRKKIIRGGFNFFSKIGENIFREIEVAPLFWFC